MKITPKALRSRERPLLTDEELRNSIAIFGPLLPVYTWRGRVLDGTRRRQICLKLGKPIDTKSFRHRRDAARLLWTLHPERCLSVFPEATLAEAAALYGTTPSKVAIVKRSLAEAPPPSPGSRLAWHLRRGPERIPRQGGRARKVQVWLDVELRHTMRLARRASGDTTEAAFIRAAILERLDRLLVPAELESLRGPDENDAGD
jgi:hypothetical protein